MLKECSGPFPTLTNLIYINSKASKAVNTYSSFISKIQEAYIKEKQQTK